MANAPLKTIKQLLDSLLEAMQGIKVLQQAKGVLADIRVNITGGSVAVSALPTLANVTTVATVSSVSTVSTVSVVTNQSQVGGVLANQQVPALQNILAISSNINNIKLT